MADSKLSALVELATAPAGTDELYIRDVSEAAADESKRITFTNLIAGLGGTPAPVLSTTNAAGAATTFLRTDDQLAVFDTTVPVTQASADVAAAGTAAVAARRDHKHGMPTLGSGALTRAGGSTTEATTTSTTATNLMTISSLSIAVGVPFDIRGSARKSAGAAVDVGLGLTLNATVVSEAAVATARLWTAGTGVNAAVAGGFIAHLEPHDGTYVRTGIAFMQAREDTGQIGNITVTANYPNATTTDVIIRGISGDALVTCACDEVHIYTFSVS